MAHLKRQKIPKEWPVPRKGTTFIVRPIGKKGIPLLVVLRDLLKVAQNRKEVKKSIHQKNILVNNKPARDEKIALELFDTFGFVSSKKHYKVNLSEGGKYGVEEIKEKDSNEKIVKVVDKKILRGKRFDF